MGITPTLPGIESLTLTVTQEIHVRASLETTFEALLEQIGPENETPERKMPMTLEPWPGGRWFRDLGTGNGHLWGHVQSIKRPTLLEITGPLFMSYPVISHVQYPAKQRRRWDADPIPPQSIWSDSGRSPARSCTRMESY
jgi:hypothetical protein